MRCAHFIAVACLFLLYSCQTVFAKPEIFPRVSSSGSHSPASSSSASLTLRLKPPGTAGASSTRPKQSKPSTTLSLKQPGTERTSVAHSTQSMRIHGGHTASASQGQSHAQPKTASGHLRLFGANIHPNAEHHPSPGNKGKGPTNLSPSKQGQRNDKVQAGASTAWWNEPGGKPRIGRPIGSTSRYTASGKPRTAWNKGQRGSWWKEAGGKPNRPPGTSPRYESSKRTRERQKERLALKQGKNPDEHPTGPHSQPKGGPPSPDPGGQAVSKRRFRPSGGRYDPAF